MRSPSQLTTSDAAHEELRDQALEYHSSPTPGKVSMHLSKPADTSLDLALAYSPGVAEPCREIFKDPKTAFTYTSKGNLVGVISNGTAVLGLGNIGPLASKPVMEGKGVLFKRFAGIDCYDIEVDTTNVDEFVNVVKAISVTFGGINLEDIKAPECFEIERRLVEVCNVPVFHDDQHGTAIVTAAAMINALDIAGKKIESAKLICLGAGAAAIACLKLLVEMGLPRKNVFLVDSKGVVYEGRDGINKYKSEFQRLKEWHHQQSMPKTLSEAIENADAFLGLSGPGLLSPENLMKMAKSPVVFACANPDPEIMPEVAKQHRPDVLIATGRSDYPNQVNNVLGFPFIFRGALDVRATKITHAMKVAACKVLCDIAKDPVPESVAKAYGGEHFEFGPDYFIPKPLDPRLLPKMSHAVAKAAIDSGVATAPYPAHYPLTSADNVLPEYHHLPATSPNRLYVKH
ncbi:malic enzyme NAD(P) protein [Gregarina niphandrodes]|uniref:Malic enzyme n=1 Tax=Gregarina niphandrodes TaxID=110365 RepID=A0A023AZR5_GRENI|nr:malic enzyme NAD(P) protein [Gregarina niphandrodes]EZG44393.1 malic enzyme NAD(P) protein [Gregarina niphandrodes]|eukprot:XP_011132671.1 malic enzyme NAD(P) protein [Gregarina niphandrodes]